MDFDERVERTKEVRMVDRCKNSSAFSFSRKIFIR